MRVKWVVFAVAGIVLLPMAGVWGQRVPASASVYSIEAETGLVLFEHNPDVRRPPASMIKLMMMLLVAEGIERGTWSLDTPLTASRKAKHMGGTQVFLETGETQPLGKLMQAIAVSSANDAAMCVAEGLWGSEEAYLARANTRASDLGMRRSEFHSVHGLPPDRGEQPDRTTARDMALLGKECVKYPQLLEWTHTVRFRLRPGEPYRYTTNKLMREMEESDGLKTGFINAAGFCITATAVRGDMRIITVVMGYTNSSARFDLARLLLLSGLDSVRKDTILARDAIDALSVSVANGRSDVAALRLENDLRITAREEDWDRVELLWDMPEALEAPVIAGTVIGEVRAVLDGELLTRSPLIVAETVEESYWSGEVGGMPRAFGLVAD